jgi:hypothetical protein
MNIKQLWHYYFPYTMHSWNFLKTGILQTLYIDILSKAKMDRAHLATDIVTEHFGDVIGVRAFLPSPY